MAQMGRPKKDKPKNKQVTIRLDEETYNELKTYCNNNNSSISEMFMRFIKVILGK